MLFVAPFFMFPTKAKVVTYKGSMYFDCHSIKTIEICEARHLHRLVTRMLCETHNQ